MESIITWAPGVTLAQLERQVILTAFRFYGENKTTTANALGIAVRTLHTKLDQYEAEKDKPNERDELSKREAEFRNRCRGTPEPAPHLANVSATDTPNGEETAAGVHPQSASSAAAQSAVSVSQRAEVQDVLPSKIATGGNRRGR